MTHIWVPRTKIIEPRDPIVVTNALAGLFKFEAIRPDGRKRVLADWFPNLILNAGLERIGNDTNDWLNACRVGTGSTTPANGQTNLVSHLVGTGSIISSTNNAQGSAPYYGYNVRTFQFGVGVAAGNLTEVGIGWDTADGSNLFSRALILDNTGTPTTLTVQSDEILNVSYECRSYVPTSNVSGNITITGDAVHAYTGKAALATQTYWRVPFSGGPSNPITGQTCSAYDGTFGATVEDQPSGASGGASGGFVTQAYSAGSLQRDWTASFLITDANFGTGIKSVMASMGSGMMQYQFTVPIPKTASDVLALNFRQTWARKTLP